MFSIVLAKLKLYPNEIQLMLETQEFRTNCIACILNTKCTFYNNEAFGDDFDQYTGYFYNGFLHEDGSEDLFVLERQYKRNNSILRSRYTITEPEPAFLSPYVHKDSPKDNAFTFITTPNGRTVISFKDSPYCTRVSWFDEMIELKEKFK